MTAKLLTDCQISLETTGTPHLRTAKFAFGSVWVSPDVLTDFFWREVLRRCPMCNGSDGSLCVMLFAHYRSSEETFVLAMAHPKCFYSLPNLTSDARQKMRTYAARFRAEFEIRRQITPPSPREF